MLLCRWVIRQAEGGYSGKEMRGLVRLRCLSHGKDCGSALSCNQWH